MANTKIAASTQFYQDIIYWLLALLFIFSPLIQGGIPSVPLMLIQLIAILLFCVSLWNLSKQTLAQGELVAIILLLLVPLVYLIPLPEAWLHWLSGRETYLAIQQMTQSEALTTASLLPQATREAWLTLLVPVAVFISTRSLATRHLFKLTLLLIGIAVFESVLGLMQNGVGRDSPLYLGMTFSHFDSGVGTYLNRNHLAGLLEMVLPVVFALLVFAIGNRQHLVQRKSRNRSVFLLASETAQPIIIYSLLTLFILVGLIFTRSRTGISLGMLAILLITMIFARYIGKRTVYGLVGSTILIALGFALLVGLAPVLERFSVEGLENEGRWEIFSATIAGIGWFSPIGSGPGSYVNLFPFFQDFDVGTRFVNHAHNDYLEWLFEAGLLAGFMIILGITLYVLRWRQVWKEFDGLQLQLVQVGAGISVLLLLLHEWVDYNLHTPANSIFFAFFAGIFFSSIQPDSTEKHRSKQRHSSHSKESNKVVPQQPTKPQYKPHPEQVPNPFLD